MQHRLASNVHVQDAVNRAAKHYNTRTGHWARLLGQPSIAPAVDSPPRAVNILLIQRKHNRRIRDLHELAHALEEYPKIFGLAAKLLVMGRRKNDWQQLSSVEQIGLARQADLL